MNQKILFIAAASLVLISIPLVLFTGGDNETEQSALENTERNGNNQSSPLLPEDRIAQNTVENQSEIQQSNPCFLNPATGNYEGDCDNSDPTPCFLNPSTGNYEGDCGTSPGIGGQCSVNNRAGTCAGSSSSCAEGFVGPGQGTCGAGLTCCVEESGINPGDLTCPDDAACLTACIGDYEATGGQCTLSAGGNTEGGVCCRLRDASGGGGGGGGGSQDPPNVGQPLPGNPPGEEVPPEDPNNFCQETVTCGECNEQCTYGGGTCQTCQNNDGTCSYSQACSDNSQDPIFKQTCGNGDFMDASEQQRSFDNKDDFPDYRHVICPGFSVCKGGPNADGLYWCIEEIDPPDQGDGDTCTQLNAPRVVDEATCDTKCANFKSCTSGEQFGACIPTSQCDNLNQPDPADPEPQDPDELPASSDYPSVTTIGNFTSGGTIYPDSKIKIKVTGKGLHKFYIHGNSTPQEDDDVVQSYNRSSIASDKFYAIGQSSLKEITFDAPAQPGKYYFVANAFKDHPSGELVCSWADKLFRRNSDGSIDLSNSLDSCNNASSGTSSIFSITVHEQQSTNDPEPQENTSTPVNGLAVTARTSPNCGGHTEIYWTEGSGDGANGYWLYRSTGGTANFEPTADNLIQGDFGAPRTSSNPYDDWNAGTPGQTVHYKVIKSNSTINNTSAPVSITTSSACGN